MKNIIIGSIITMVVIGSAIVIFNENNEPKSERLADVLEDYKQLAENIQNEKTKSDLLANCKNPKHFNKKIQELESQLQELKTRKYKATHPDKKKPYEEYIPELPVL